MNNKKYKGFSLIEILLVLGVIVGLSISAFMIYQKINSNKEIKKMVSDVTNLTIASKEFESFASVNSYSSGDMIDGEIFIKERSGVFKNANDYEFKLGEHAAGNISVTMLGDKGYAMLSVMSPMGLPQEICVSFINESQKVTGLGVSMGSPIKTYTIKELTDVCEENPTLFMIPLTILY